MAKRSDYILSSWLSFLALIIASLSGFFVDVKAFSLTLLLLNLKNH